MTDDEALDALVTLCAGLSPEKAYRVESLVADKHRGFLAQREVEFIEAHRRARGCSSLGFRSGSWVSACEQALKILRENGEI